MEDAWLELLYVYEAWGVSSQTFPCKEGEATLQVADSDST